MGAVRFWKSVRIFSRLDTWVEERPSSLWWLRAMLISGAAAPNWRCIPGRGVASPSPVACAFALFASGEMASETADKATAALPKRNVWNFLFILPPLIYNNALIRRLPGQRVYCARLPMLGSRPRVSLTLNLQP